MHTERSSWLNTYRALQNLGFAPEDAASLLADARAGGSIDHRVVDIQHWDDDDTFTLYTEKLR
jgi:hypothetical protein